jgi:hypothetical protein
MGIFFPANFPRRFRPINTFVFSSPSIELRTTQKFQVTVEVYYDSMWLDVCTRWTTLKYEPDAKGILCLSFRKEIQVLVASLSSIECLYKPVAWLRKSSFHKRVSLSLQALSVCRCWGFLYPSTQRHYRRLNILYFSILLHSLTLNICSFVRQCNTFTS